MRVTAAVADAPRLLIGNKCDCTPAAVSTDEATRYADTHGMPLFETSAKADSQAEHVDAILMTLVHKLREHKPMSVRSTADAVQLPTTGDVTATTPQSSGCSCF
jgi:Ras-related protein Rab-33B